MVDVKIGRTAKADRYMNAAERLIERGREQGYREGCEQGLREARETLWQRSLEEGKALFRRQWVGGLIAIRFGEVDDTVLDRVQALDDSRIAVLWDILLTPEFEPTTIEALFEELGADSTAARSG